jgi:U3 small nucleolar RNA-associated protein 3
MGKKRKSTTGRSKDEAAQPVEQTKYQINEEFADSEDEFFAGRDHILLDNNSSNKRQKLHEDGRLSRFPAAYKIVS